MSDTIRKPKRGKGRPPSIDRLAALDAAVLTFWRHGYEGTSLTSLTAAMRLSRPSLYAGFGDKEDLFIAALERYDSTIGRRSIEAFERVTEIHEAVRTLIVAAVESFTQPGLPTGCLFANCASTVAETNDGVRKLLNMSMKTGEQLLTVRFAAETALGTLSDNPAPAARAAILIDLMTAQAIRARSGESRQDLMAGLEARVAAVTVDHKL